MIVLQNDVTTAQTRATAIAQGIQTLANAGVVMKDSQTTVVGNTMNANSAIDLSQNVSTQVASVLLSMSQDIQSVSAAFQAMDVQLGHQLRNLEKSREFSLNDPK